MKIKHYVGSITLTDNQASFEISSHIEEFQDEREPLKNYCDPIFFMNINPYNKKNDSLHMMLNSIEVRALIEGISLLSYKKITKYTKITGGNSSECHLNVYRENNYTYIGLIRGESKARISFKQFELLAFSKELGMLADTTSTMLFQHQQIIFKRKEALKEEKNYVQETH